MAVPGHKPVGAPAGLAETELFAVDAYARDFETVVHRVDRARRTAFYRYVGCSPKGT